MLSDAASQWRSISPVAARLAGQPTDQTLLKAPDVPSVLVELGYLSSRQDEKQLNDPVWRERVAKAMVRAIEKFFSRQLAANSP